MKDKKIKKFNEMSEEKLDISDVRQRKIYLISSDGYRDSINLEKCAVDENGIILILDEELKEINYKLIKNSVKIDYVNEIIKFKYIDYADEIEKSEYKLHSIYVV